MDQPITIRYTWDIDEYLAAFSAHNRRALRRPSHIAILVCFLLIAIASIVAGFLEKRWWRVLLGVVLLAYQPLSTAVVRLVLRFNYSRRPDKNRKIVWQFSPERITIESQQNQAEFSWEALDVVVESPKGFLLYPNQEMFYWVPKAAFPNQDALASFTNIAGTKAPKYEVLK
ncbi:MAG TPA: YcxB family protein [Armatimonadota bacterium]|nr:YcxB family protein [Armatimonadota bacterium]